MNRKYFAMAAVLVLGMFVFGGCGGGGDSGGGVKPYLMAYTIHGSGARLINLKSEYSRTWFDYLDISTELYSYDVKTTPPTAGNMIVPGPVLTKSRKTATEKLYSGSVNTLALSMDAVYQNIPVPYVSYYPKNNDINEFVMFINNDSGSVNSESSFHGKNVKFSVGEYEFDQPLHFRSTQQQVETDKVAPYIELTTNYDGYVTGGKGKLINLEKPTVALKKGEAGAQNFFRFQDFVIVITNSDGTESEIGMNFTQSDGKRWIPNDGAVLEFGVAYEQGTAPVKTVDVKRAGVGYRVNTNSNYPKVQGFVYRWNFTKQ